jgi:hypothetical protein
VSENVRGVLSLSVGNHDIFKVGDEVGVAGLLSGGELGNKSGLVASVLEVVVGEWWLLVDALGSFFLLDARADEAVFFVGPERESVIARMSEVVR